ncbi:tetratricopeptide repeat protein [Streptomyces sp. NBC_01477]|uniref:tetratricopeptide repeat protein n=1 Tax=Streptomyces sp. NBC_01477 TaxID=2976015 RepID=UPI002E3215AA|nr:tetratricopeptide repeat protein [Streptomyces sp. NBC_01477]
MTAAYPDDLPVAGTSVEGRASGQGRVYQAARDQMITEHHHHYQAPASWPGPDSVRVALAERVPKILRNRSRLRAALSEAIARPSGIHVVHGMGGCGKTTLAYWAFHEALRQSRIGLWVSASERMTLRASMLAVAADRGASPGELSAAHLGQRAGADLVWHYLDRSPEPWLLVIDNADDPTLLEEGGWLRASPVGTVLVTSRRATPSLWRGAVMHRLDVLPLEDAAQVLCDLAPEAGTLHDAKGVARRLGCLPLALDLAGSYLSHQLLESWTMSDYHDHLQDDPAGLIDQGTESSDARHLVSRTWQITLDQLAAQGLPEAATLLQLLSCFGPEPIPLYFLAGNATLLSGLKPPLPGGRLEASLRGLLDHSLATLTQPPGGSRCVQVHGLLLDSIHGSLPVSQRTAYVEAASRILSQDLATADSARLRLIAPHATALLNRAGEAIVTSVVPLAVRVAQAIHDAGDYAAALALAALAAATSRRLQGAEHPDTLAARHQQGDSLRRMANFSEADQLLLQVQQLRGEVLGDDHPDTLRTASLRAMPLFLLGRRDESLDQMRRAIEAQRRVLGDNHEETLKSRALNLEYLAATGKTDEFLGEGQVTVTACERFLGPDHPVTAIAHSNYAYGLIHAGTPAEAEDAARRALDLRIRVHGLDHPLVYSAKLVLSWALMLRGDHDRAVPLMREAVAGRERLLGPDHQLTLKARVLLAERLSAAGQHEEAQHLLRDNLPAAERGYGTADPDLVRARALFPN